MSTVALALLSLLSGSGVIPGEPGCPDGASNLTAGGLIWSFDAGPSRATVTLGDRGGQVVVGNTLQDVQLYSSYDSNPPTLVWQGTYVDEGGGEIAAREADVYLATEIALPTPTSSQALLHEFTSSSGTPKWTFAFTPQLFSFVSYDLSRDGRVIVSNYYDEATVQSQLRIHDPSTGVPSHTFLLPIAAPVGRFDVSPDGSMAASSRGAITNSFTDVIDLGTGSVVFSTPGMLPRRQGLSEEGRVLVVQERNAADGWHVRVFVKQGATYLEVIDRRSPLDVTPYGMAVSDDGSTVAAAWFHDATPGRLVVRAFDVASGAMTMEHSQPVPSLDNFPYELAISADGSRFVVGSYGDGAGLAAELAVYSPRRNQPLVEYPAGGSVFGVDISPDGRRFVASRGANHAQNGYHHARIEMYELGGEDLVARGRPSIGQTIDFEVHAPPGAAAFLLSSTRLAPEPIVLPGVGTLFLAPSLLHAVRLGVIPPEGSGAFAFAIANDPALIGRTIWFQALTTHPRTLSTDFVQLTIVP